MYTLLAIGLSLNQYPCVMVFDLAILDHIFCHWKKGRKRKNDNELDLIQIHLKLHQPIIAFCLAGGLTLSKFKFSYCIIENSGI